jgi:hypothetical protein
MMKGVTMIVTDGAGDHWKKEKRFMDHRPRSTLPKFGCEADLKFSSLDQHQLFISSP